MELVLVWELIHLNFMLYIIVFVHHQIIPIFCKSPCSTSRSSKGCLLLFLKSLLLIVFMIKNGQESDHFQLKFLISVISLSPLIDHLIIDLFLFWNLWNFLFNKLYGLRLHGEILRTLLKCFGIDFWNDSIPITVKYLMFETLVDFCIEELNTLDVLIFCEVEKLIFIWLIICHLPNIFVFIEIHHSIRLFPQ